MVSRTTKKLWKSVAIGLALSPVMAIENAVLAQTPAPTISATKDSTPPANAGDVEAVRKLVQEGRKALAEGDKAKAEKLARQAMSMKVSLPFWENDTPEKLLLEIGVKTTPPAKQPSMTGKTTTDPKQMVKLGYEALKGGNLDEAQRLAQAANSDRNARWGLFEETPSKLLDEVQKARASKNKAESGKLLTEARKAYETGKLEDAEKLAYQAASLHGPYSLWDMSDRPEKLISEIQTAKEKQRKTKVPAVPGTTTTTASNKPANSTPASPATAKPGTMPASAVAQGNPPAPTWPKDIATADSKATGPNAVATASAAMPASEGDKIIPVNTTGSDTKAKAVALVSEGKALQGTGRYVEARVKFIEAQQCKAEFAPSEVNPDACLIELASTVMKQIDSTVREIQSASNSAAIADFDGKVKSCRALATSFGLDVQPIDTAVAKLASTPAQPAIPTPTASADSIVQGQSMLEKARLELKRGQCDTARQIATEVHNGPFGMQTEAAAMLRTIDVEEHNQRVLNANRNFDAAMASFRAKDNAQCLAVLRQVDANLLAPEKRAQMKEVVASCQKSDVAVAKSSTAGSPIQQTSGAGTPAAGVTQASASSDSAKAKPTGEGTGDSLASQVQAMQEIEYQRLRAEGLEVQSKAMAQFERGETEAAMETLDGYTKKLKSAKLDSASVARLQRPIDARAQSFKLLKAQKDFDTNVVKKKEKFNEEMSKAVQADLKKQQQVKECMKKFNALYKEGKYKEAELEAAKAHELDPDDPATEAALKLAQIHGATSSYDEIAKRKDKMVLNGLNEAEDPGPAVGMNNPVHIDMPTLKLAKNREKDKNGITLKNYTEKEKEISAKLAKPITVSFTNVPLKQAIEDLRATTGLNIYADVAAFQAESINPEQPVSIKVDNISLKSALNLMLSQAHLTYVIKDEVLKITTEKAARGSLVQKVYSVADLVIPIDDYILPQHSNLQASFDRVSEQQRVNLTGGSTPFANGRNQLQNGVPVGAGSSGLGAASMRTNPDGTSQNGVQPGNVGSPMSYSTSVSPTKQTMQDMLIKLITNTVAPDSWSAVGGAGTIDYMPIGLALVVNQTPDVQEQVVDLLEALRRLQDLEVAVEVRIISLAETFFERIGLDFALNIKTDHSTTQYEPQLVTNQFKPAGQINDFSPTRFLSGVNPAGMIGPQRGTPGSFTGDLDIPIRSSSFQYAIPPFAYPNNPGFNGGLTLGLAFLSDIQVYMFMEAAQGDRRTNVMQAPKLTLFNGQTATLTIADQQFFVTNVNVIGFGGQIVFVPQNNPFPVGVNLTIQAVVSADRRFVRLNMAPTLTNLASAMVPLFPVTTFITPVFEGGAQGQPIPFTQFIQQPNFSSVTINTTVAVPDGGTVIMGGMKTLSEGRNEFGPPVLSKLPYVNRLFKNVGYGREAQSLLLMVTPRIIINAEEEERQTGYQSITQPQ